MAYDEVLSALADPTRRAVLERMREGPRSVGALAEGLPVSRPAVSQHLGVLRRAGLVSEARDGTRRIYAIDEKGLSELRDYVDRLWTDGLEAYRRAAVARAARR